MKNKVKIKVRINCRIFKVVKKVRIRIIKIRIIKIKNSKIKIVESIVITWIFKITYF